MSYRLKSGEPPSQGLKRVFREETQSALQLCRRPFKQRGITVHETRKHLKKLRAALRLAAAKTGKDQHAREDRSLSEIAKLVSDLRDAHVRLQTLIRIREDMHGHSALRSFPKIEELLSMELESFSAAFAGWRKQAIPKLKAAKKRLSDWPLDDTTWKQVCGAVAKSYRRGRDALTQVLKKPSPGTFHEWRKEVKQLWYQLRLLQPLNRVVLEKIASDAKTLGELLGLDHDFAFLLARLEAERNDSALQAEHAALQKLIRKRSRKLQRNATELGRRFYAEGPKAFAKRISIFIKDWKSKKKKKRRPAKK
jgi:CHAD domain-containing protein